MKKILIIEDDAKIRRFLQLELEHEGYQIDLAENGEEGLSKVQKFYYDIILLDLMLPLISGEEVCKKIRAVSNVPIIVITAKDDIRNKVELLDMGADDYITKPFFTASSTLSINLFILSFSLYIGATTDILIFIFPPKTFFHLQMYFNYHLLRYG